MFNIIGVTWMLFLAPVFLHLISIVFPAQSATSGNTFALAAFHTTFNTLNVLILIAFVPHLVRIATRMVKSKGDDDEEFQLHYLNQGVVGTTSISIEEAKKEVVMFGKTVHKMSHILIEQSDAVKEKKLTKLNKKIRKYEDITDELEEQISQFLLKVSQSKLSEDNSREVQALLSIITDLERVADIILRMSNDLIRKNKKDVVFNSSQRQNLIDLSNLVDEAILLMLENLSSAETNFKVIRDKESQINSFVKDLRKDQFSSIDKPDYDVKAGIVYRDLYNSYEKIADHLENVSEAFNDDLEDTL
jgi:phosphate:Na+ symporter